MQIVVGWWDLAAPAVSMLLSILLSLAMRWWRRRQDRVPKWHSRTHWEWLPFMFGLTGILAELPRVLGASNNLVSTFDTIAGIFGFTVVLMLVRWLVLLCARGGRLLFEFGRGSSSGSARAADTSV